MAEILSLAGRPALSSFRLAKLLQSLSQARSAHRIDALDAAFWHFVELARPLTADERRTLEALLTYGPEPIADAHVDGTLLLVVPRPGTISPWSSKATDIARNCGLDAVRRIERGIDWHATTRGGKPLSRADRERAEKAAQAWRDETALDLVR